MGHGGEYHTSIKVAVEMRPREKLLARGEEYLSEAELLAILLGSGSNCPPSSWHSTSCRNTMDSVCSRLDHTGNVGA